MTESEMLTSYIGKPYSFRNYNCWQHVAQVRKDFGIKTKMFKPRTKKEAFELITAQMSVIDNGLALVYEPKNFDIVMVGVMIGKSMRYHCGVYYDGMISHCCNDFGSVRYQPMSEFKEKYTEVTLWR